MVSLGRGFSLWPLILLDSTHPTLKFFLSDYFFNHREFLAVHLNSRNMDNTLNTLGKQSTSTMKKLLIVEDNYIMRLFLVNYFNTEFNVIAVEKPHQARELLKNEYYDLVIMDNHVKKSKDHEELKELIAQLKWQNIPNVVLTDSEKSNERIEALMIGAEDTISKPFNPVELRLKVKSRTGMIKGNIKNVA